jgi:DNA-binding CsgD family transcriptional regulator
MKSRQSKDHPLFSKNEIATMRLICKQYTNLEIAESMEKSVRTIDGYRECILQKTKAKNTAGIVVYAIKHGIYKL